ncbi:hypothetical protein ACRWQM_13180 [Shewanella sp. HL-SH5]|uniref:hypothetical protein n=1 Tax=unclassified Shewanella TaxID=196818 RepID=UPI003EC09006
MKLLSVIAFTVTMGVFTTPAFANSFDVCLTDSESPSCNSYLEGVVDGALMYRKNVPAKKVNADGGYESRALKYRAGKRYQKANAKYCVSHIPDSSDIVDALTEQVSMGNVSNSDDLETVINSLMDCRSQ